MNLCDLAEANIASNRLLRPETAGVTSHNIKIKDRQSSQEAVLVYPSSYQCLGIVLEDHKTKNLVFQKDWMTKGCDGVIFLFDPVRQRNFVILIELKDSPSGKGARAQFKSSMQLVRYLNCAMASDGKDILFSKIDAIFLKPIVVVGKSRAMGPSLTDNRDVLFLHGPGIMHFSKIAAHILDFKH